MVFTGGVTTRRQQQRTDTTAEIKRAALDHIAAHGAAEMSIRGIARAIGMSPAGLYRYFDGRDALLTELLVDAYRDLADDVEAAAGTGGGVRGRLRAAMLAYRKWSIAHPNRFLLIFGTPVPGYRAPADGPTVAQNLRIGATFFGLIAQGQSSGELSVPAAARPATAAEREFVAMMGDPLPADRVAPVLGTWAHFHGLVTLEVLHQLDFVYPDATEFYAGEVDRILAQW